MLKLPHVIHIDMRNSQMNQAYSRDISLGKRPADRPKDEQLLVVMHNPTPYQALRHVGVSLALFTRSLVSAFRAYARRIDRGYIRTHYSFRNGVID